jgi:hypothetical protein
MARWKPYRIEGTPINGTPPKIRKKGAPSAKGLKKTPAPPGITRNGKPVVGAQLAKGFKRPASGTTGATGAAGAAGKPWYDPANMASRDAALVSALSDPLKPVTGEDAVAYARALSQSQIAPVLQDYDRQSAEVQSRAGAQSARTTQGNDTLRALIAQNLGGQQQSAATARDRIAGAGAQLTASVDQGAAQAGQAAAQDAATRGAGLDGGTAAQRAQEAANARARGQAGTSIALDQQASSAQSGDQLLQQISAATAQQGGERLGSITSALNSSLRDVNQGRAKALASGEDTFLKSIMDLQGQNIQTKLATETLGLNREKATADSAIEAAKLEQKNELAKLNAKLKITEGAANREVRRQIAEVQAEERRLDRLSRETTADKDRDSADKRAASKTKAAGKKPVSLTPQDKQRRSFISDVQVAKESGQMATLAKQAKNNPSTYRKLLAEKMGVKDSFSRQLLADLQFGGLRPSTVNAYRARYGRNPPSDWRRYKAPKKSTGSGAGLGTTVTGQL